MRKVKWNRRRNSRGTQVGLCVISSSELLNLFVNCCISAFIHRKRTILNIRSERRHWSGRLLSNWNEHSSHVFDENAFDLGHVSFSTGIVLLKEVLPTYRAILVWLADTLYLIKCPFVGCTVVPAFETSFQIVNTPCIEPFGADMKRELEDLMNTMNTVRPRQKHLRECQWLSLRRKTGC